MGKSVGVISLKGGVGKTSSVAALGSALADFGKSVLLVDANFSAPNLGLHFNLVDPEVTLHHVLDRVGRLRDSIYNMGKVHLMPSSLFYSRAINPLRLRNAIKNLKRRYDVTVIDSSPSLGDETLGAMLASDELLVVTTPDVPTLSTTLKSVKRARQQGVPITGLVLNKVHNKDFEVSIDDIESTAEVPVLAVIPHDLNILRALRNALPITDFKPKAEASEEFRKLAGAMIGQKYKPFEWKKFFQVFTPSREEINREILYRRVFRDEPRNL